MARRKFGRRGYLLLSILCFWTFGFLLVVANNMYLEYPNARHTDGVVILFGRELPRGFGHGLWLTFNPLLLGTFVAGCWFVYRCVRIWRLGLVENLCRVCGYDIRASPDRCPECGTVVADDET